MSASRKVVGVGLNKTGTTSLGLCLRHWGLNHISCNKEAFRLWRESRVDELMESVARYDSFEDWPWPLVYQAIDQRFPDTKFILTRRKDAETWFDSICRHAHRTGPTDYRKFVYGHEMPHNHKADHVRVYEEHLQAVRDYFSDRPGDLLEVCWAEGDGWHELSSFLGFERPEIPFPHANPGWSFPALMYRRSVRGLRRAVRRLRGHGRWHGR